MTSLDPATGLVHGSFGFGTYRRPDGTAFPGLVLPDGRVYDLSGDYHDTHALLDDWRP